MSNIIKQLEQEQMKQDVPSFRPGDTVEVKVWVVEGSKKRLSNVVVLFVKLNCTTCVSVLVRLLVSKSVLTDNVFALHPKRVMKQGVSELLTPFSLVVAANWRQRLARWRQI